MDSLASSGSAALPDDDYVSHHAAEMPTEMSSGAFGTLLEPVLRDVCGGRLSPITWFRTDWQRGGAVTGYADWCDDNQFARPVVVKLPVPPCERYWLVALQEAQDVAPEVYAHGESLGGYDLAWIVMERVPYGPLGLKWGAAAFDLLVEAAGRFYQVAESHPRSGEPLREDWEGRFHQAREIVQDHALPDAQRWNRALKKAHRKLKQWIGIWEQRPTTHWCHGDLHLGNAMTRNPPPAGPALLFDFAKTRVGHWVQDAVFFEHFCWSHPDRLDGRKLCKAIAQERRRRGLPDDSAWPQYASIKRALLAMSTPAMLRFDGDRAHVAAALTVLEREVG